jgi:hypothetical protein
MVVASVLVMWMVWAGSAVKVSSVSAPSCVPTKSAWVSAPKLTAWIWSWPLIRHEGTCAGGLRHRKDCLYQAADMLGMEQSIPRVSVERMGR